MNWEIHLIRSEPLGDAAGKRRACSSGQSARSQWSRGFLCNSLENYSLEAEKWDRSVNCQGERLSTHSAIVEAGRI